MNSGAERDNPAPLLHVQPRTSHLIVLGINAYHGDASACLVRDGELVAAVEEERFRRIKHWAGFPVESISYCLSVAGIGLADVSHVAVNSLPRAHVVRKLRYLVALSPDWKRLSERVQRTARKASTRRALRAAFPGVACNARIHRVEHHLAHLASCFFVSPFEDALALSVDGFGDFASAAWGLGSGGDLSVDERIYFPHSLGIFYQALTQYLGFHSYGDEYKVMGLAAYGKPSWVEPLRQVVRLQDDGTFKLGLEFFRHHRERVSYEWHEQAPEVGALFSRQLEHLLGPARGSNETLSQRHRDLACSVQATYETALFHLLDRLQDKYRVENLALAGGCALNSVANGKLYRNTRFKHVYVQAAAGDAGGALGAAFAVWVKASRGERRFIMDHSYWGPGYREVDVERCLQTCEGALGNVGGRVEKHGDEADLCRAVAARIAGGKVVGWFQGRMEWGPRALGNRSILCDPRRNDMKDILNIKIKRRESFRPFAPSVLSESASEWFDAADDVPFMLKVFQIRKEKTALIPAVTHVDGSGRLQTVSRESSPRFHRLISAFADLTGVPMLLNTSFNENEPIVCTPEQALDCFLRTGMDLLVLGDYVVSRRT